jgi:hypothetical protein
MSRCAIDKLWREIQWFRDEMKCQCSERLGTMMRLAINTFARDPLLVYNPGLVP